jgi:hypothetical protein
MEALGAQRSARAFASPAGTAAAVARGVAAGLIALAGLVAGVGTVYLLRTVGPLAVGPNVPGALPLQQLAGGESQPVLRVAIAWIPAGVVAGLALARLTSLNARTRALVLAIPAATLLLLAGAAADAIAITDPLQPHLLPQLTRPGTWVAVALFALGSLLAEPLRERLVGH